MIRGGLASCNIQERRPWIIVPILMPKWDIRHAINKMPVFFRRFELCNG